MYLAHKKIKGQGFKSCFKQSDLPPQIDKDRLLMLVSDLRQGNARVAEEIIGGHMGLAFQIVGRYVNQCPNKTDEILSVALMAIVEAVTAFPLRGVDNNITPYIVSTIHSKITDFICHDSVIKITRYKLRQLAEEFQLTEEENLPTIATVTDIDARSTIGKQIIKAFSYTETDTVEFKEILDRVSFTREESLVVKYISQGMSETEAANEIGISRQRINQAKKRIRAKLLPYFVDKEDILCKSCSIWMVF